MSRNRLAPVKIEIADIETKYFLGQINDVTYNEEWWKWYCQENKLDVNTGKSLRGSSYPRPANYTLF